MYLHSLNNFEFRGQRVIQIFSVSPKMDVHLQKVSGFLVTRILFIWNSFYIAFDSAHISQLIYLNKMLRRFAKPAVTINPEWEKVDKGQFRALLKTFILNSFTLHTHCAVASKTCSKSKVELADSFFSNKEWCCITSIWNLPYSPCISPLKKCNYVKKKCMA